jgi:hypothetical protein
MKKQTAVEWYEKEIMSLIRKYENKEISKWDYIIMRHNLFYPAKTMEREQIRDNYIAGFNERDEVDKSLFFNPLAVTYCEKVFNKYYNETYGGDK